MARSKGPRILRIENERGGDEWSVKITFKQLMRLSTWVWRDHLRWQYDGDHHALVLIQAKDELEAMMRFNQLWAGLPKIGE
jgi:hypothetical protein